MDTSSEMQVDISGSGRAAVRSVYLGERKTSRSDAAAKPRWLLLSFAVVLCLMALTLCWRQTAQLLNKPLTEDGYLVLSVARNLAIGHGLSVDGVHGTNGFQPLFAVMASLPYLVTGGNRIAGIRSVLALDLLCYITTGILVGLICRTMFKPGTRSYHLAAPFGMVCYLSADFVIASSFNGLETGTLLLLYALIWYYWATHGLQSIIQQAVLGVLLGFAVLARIDSVFLVGAVAAYFIWRKQIRAAALAVTLAIVVSAPWWVYNVALTGSFMPTSGHAEHAWGLSILRITEIVQAIGTDAMPWTYLSQEAPFWATIMRILAATAIITVCLRLAHTSANVTSGGTSGRAGSFGRIIVAVAGTLVIWYILYSSATYFYARYLAPLTLVAVVGGTWLLFRAIDGRSVATLIGIGLGLSAAAVVVYGAYDVGNLFPGNMPLTRQLSLVNSWVPAGTAVAAGQSGTLSYFRDDVVNLDGKSNIDALAHSSDIPEYLNSLRVRWICDEPRYIHVYLGANPTVFGWHLVATKGGFELWRHG